MTLDQFETYLASALYGNMLAISEATSTYPYYICPQELELDEYPWFWMENALTDECNYCILGTDDELLSDKATIATFTEREIEDYTYDLALKFGPERYARMLETVNA